MPFEFQAAHADDGARNRVSRTAGARHKKSVALNPGGHAFLIMRTRVRQKD
jgi:hypothetical protein